MSENHVASRVGWLRAAVLGANDGLISTSSLMLGVAAAGTPMGHILLTGVAGLVSGAMSMAAGEYVSVSSQGDAEKSDFSKERKELAADPEGELQELTDIYVGRGVEPGLARQVAEQMTAKDALGTHARDELGITELTIARPIQAAMASAVSFAAGAALPIIATVCPPSDWVRCSITAVGVAGLAILGALGAYLGGAPVARGTARVVFWGCMAMAVTAAIGKLVGHSL